jgi:F-type H+-transporting ATPase subunit gamma
MAFLAEIKNHIQSTKNTQKITQAMQLVAANKMKVFQKKAVNARRYAWSLLEGLALCHQSIEASPYAEKREKGETVFVFITSDKGLCGSLNVRMLEKIFKSEKWLKTPESERVLRNFHIYHPVH